MGKMVLVITILSLLSISVLSEDKSTVAVLDLQVLGGLSPSEALILSEKVREALFLTGKFKVLDRSAMDEILTEMGLSQSGCTSNECIIQAGRMLSAQKMVAGSVGKIGGTYTLSLKLVDVQTAEIENIASVDCKGCELDLVAVNSPKEAVGKLVASPIIAPPVAPRMEATSGKNFGSLIVESDPSGAEVSLAGAGGRIGFTPVSKSLKPGNYKVQVKMEPYEIYEQAVLLKEGEVTRVTTKLKLKTGSLVVSTDPPNADIFIQNQISGKSPQTISELPLGDYDVSLRLSGYSDYNKKVKIQYKSPTRLDVRLHKLISIGTVQKRQALVISALVPGMGQVTRLHQGWKGLLYFGAFAGCAYLTYDSYNKYNDAKDDYENARLIYGWSSSQAEFDANYQWMTSAYQDMKDYKTRNTIFFLSAGGIWAWNLADILIWGGGKDQSSQTGREQGKIEFGASPDKIKISVNF